MATQTATRSRSSSRTRTGTVAARPRQTVQGSAETGSHGPTRQQRYDSGRARARQVAPTQKITRSNYQPVILVEFVACIILTAATPIATKTTGSGLSPYGGKTIVKLASLTLLYLILAMISVGGRGPGRFAAWFGGLILIVDGMAESANILKDFGLVSGSTATSTSTSSGGATGTTQAANTTTAAGRG
jgi:hypothetical protein